MNNLKNMLESIFIDYVIAPSHKQINELAALCMPQTGQMSRCSLYCLSSSALPILLMSKLLYPFNRFFMFNSVMVFMIKIGGNYVWKKQEKKGF